MFKGFRHKSGENFFKRRHGQGHTFSRQNRANQLLDAGPK
jgi:hypothetical protein